MNYQGLALTALVLTALLGCTLSPESNKGINTESDQITYEKFDNPNGEAWLLPTYPYVELPPDAVLLEVGFGGKVKLGKCIVILNDPTNKGIVPIFQAGRAQRDDQGRLVLHGKTYADGDAFSASIDAYYLNNAKATIDPEAQKIDEVCGSQGSVFVTR